MSELSGFNSINSKHGGFAEIAHHSSGWMAGGYFTLIVVTYLPQHTYMTIYVFVSVFFFPITELRRVRLICRPTVRPHPPPYPNSSPMNHVHRSDMMRWIIVIMLVWLSFASKALLFVLFLSLSKSVFFLQQL